jgi:DNA-directed RNA polymerase alpha subunit
MNLTITVTNEDEARQAQSILESYIRGDQMHFPPHEDQRVGTPIAELGLSTRAANVLRSVGIETIEELLCWHVYELRRLPNLGVQTLKEITDVITARGLQLGQPFRRTPIPT